MIALTVSSTAEPPLEQFPYAGWVPTANGRLSFRHVGEALHPSEAIYANVATSTRRIVLAFQRRSFNDLLFQRVLEFFCEVEDRFWFVIAAESRGDPVHADQLAGKIYVYKSKDDWKSKARKYLRERIYELNDWRLSIDPGRENAINSLFSEAMDRVESSCDFFVEFELNRTGEVYFSNSNFLDQNLEFESFRYAESLRQDFSKSIADQCYFFLRDIIHNHQHHVPSADTILVLQKRDCEGVDWRRKIIYSLYHYIIRTRRSDKKIASLHQAAGILAYCRSYRTICDTALGARADQIPYFNNETLLQSLNARAAEQAQIVADWGVRVNLQVARRALALAILAVVIAMFVMMVQPQIEKDEFHELAELSKAFARHFLGIAAFLITCLMTIWVSTSGWMLKWTVGRDILEASNVRRARSIALFVALAFLVGGITAWLGWPAIQDLWAAFSDLRKGFHW